MMGMNAAIIFVISLFFFLFYLVFLFAELMRDSNQCELIMYVYFIILRPISWP